MPDKDTPANRLVQELRRRRVFQTAAIYIVGSWLLMQVADVLFPAMDIPERAIRYVFLAALFGFPAALVFGWFYEVGAHGIRRTPTAGPDADEESRPLGRSDYFILTALVAVLIAILYNTIGNVVELPAPIKHPEQSGPPVVAVLPFTASSLGGESEFFARGVHDDLLTQLSKLDSIRVISRTSVLEYRDTTRNLREIGSELGAHLIVEGGVQVAGDKIRINAQLIDTRTDEHLWAETFNRSLSASSIFDVQADIARAIAAATNATLSEQDNQQLSVVPTENMAAYRSYLKAMDNRAGHGPMTHEERADALENAVALDPGFARAWAELVGAYSMMSFGSPIPEHVQNAERALEKIKELAPGSADYFVAQAYYLYYVLKEYDRAHEILNKAISMVPSDVSLLELRAWIERRQGDFDARGETIRTMIQLDPRNQSYRGTLVDHLISTHQYDEALAAIEGLDQTDAATAAFRESMLVKDHGDFGLWLERMLRLEGRLHGLENYFLWLVYVANRMYPEAEEVIELIPESRDPGPGNISAREELYLWTWWLTNDRDRLDEMVPRVTQRLEAARQENGEFLYHFTNRYLSLVKGASGDREESLRLLRRFVELDAGDWAGRVHNTDDICPMFAMNEAVIEAVECLRVGVSDPSFVMPFIEPYMPFYDAIRDEPQFIELVEELEGD